MKTIGLFGGTTWHATLEYYRQLNEEIAARLGEHGVNPWQKHGVNPWQMTLITNRNQVVKKKQVPFPKCQLGWIDPHF